MGDVSREDFLRAITDPDKFREFADQQGWGNKRRQMAWDALHNYAQGVQKGEINEIDSMHQVIDDTGVRTNKKEKYNLIGSKFDANGAVASFMNQTAKGLSATTKDTSLKSIPSVSSYLNNLWFGSDTPDWSLFQKNDVVKNGVYGITNRQAKLKAGLQRLKNELTTNGAKYNWDGVDKNTYLQNLTDAINSSNIASYAPLGLNSEYLNNVLATKDLTSATYNTELPTDNPTADNPTADNQPVDENASIVNSLSDDAKALYDMMTPEQKAQYIKNIKTQMSMSVEDALAQQQASIDAVQKRAEDAKFMEWLKSNGHFSPRAQFTSQVSARLQPSSYYRDANSNTPGAAVGDAKSYDSANNKYMFTNDEWKSFIQQDLNNTTLARYALNGSRTTTKGTIKINSKLDWLNYNFDYYAAAGLLAKIGDDVSSYVGAARGTVWRLKNSKRSSDGTWMYMRKRGNNLEFYRSKSWNDLRNTDYKNKVKKHQFGGSVSQQALREQYEKDLKARQDAIVAQKPTSAPTLRTTVKNNKSASYDTLTTADKVSIAAAAADLVSSFSGNPLVNAGGTLLTTTANAFSDASHGASAADIAQNAAVNVGWGLVGFVPGLGTMAKAKRFKKALQFASGSLQTYFITNGLQSGLEALSNIMNDRASVQDYKNLVYALGAGKGAVNSVQNTVKRRGAAKVIESTDLFKAGDNKYTFKSKGKETERLTAAQVKELQEKGSAGVSDDIKKLLNGVEIKPKKNLPFGFTYKQSPREYQYKTKEEIQAALNDPQNGFQSKLASFWNPGKQDYLAMTSEHRWYLPSFTWSAGKNSPRQVIDRINNPQHEQPTPRPTTDVPSHDFNAPAAENAPKSQPKWSYDGKSTTAGPYVSKGKDFSEMNIVYSKKQYEADKALLIKRINSEKPLPIDDATRDMYFHVYHRMLSDADIQAMEQNFRIAHAWRAMENNYATYQDQFNARKKALQDQLDVKHAEAKEAAALQADIEKGKAELREAQRNTWLRTHPSRGAREVSPDAIRVEANRQYALNWVAPKPPLAGAARNAKQASYEKLWGTTKKKTSRGTKKHQNGGVLYDYNFLNSVHAFRKGGIIKAQNGTKTHSNIYSADTNDYGYNTYLNKLFQDDAMLAQMRTHYNLDDYAQFVQNNVNQRYQYGINDYQNDATYTPNENVRTFNKGYQNDGTLTFNYTLFGNNAEDYNNMQNGAAYKYISFTRPAKAMQTGDAYNTDATKAYIDNARGLQTYSRVASLTDANIKSGGFGNWGESWKQKGATGAYYYIAPNDTSGRGQWIPTADTTQAGYVAFDKTKPETKTTSSATTPDIGEKSIFDKGKEYLANLTGNYGNLYNAAETLKYGLANKTTNDLAKIKMPNVAYTAKHTGYQTMDNLSQYNAYSNAAATNLSAATKHPITSSGQLQAAQQQEAQNANNKTMLAGNVERNTHLDTEREKSYKAGLYNMENAVDNNNTNLQQWWKTRVQNEYTDPRARLIGLATNRQNYINALEKFNIIDPYTEQKNAVQQYNLAKAQWDYTNDPNLEAAKIAYQKEYKAHKDDLDWDATSSDAYKKLQEEQKKATAKYYTNLYSTYGIKHPIFTVKKGGKFEDISKFNTKEFYNTVRHSINTALKQGTDLSKLIISGKK